MTPTVQVSAFIQNPFLKISFSCSLVRLSYQSDQETFQLRERLLESGAGLVVLPMLVSSMDLGDLFPDLIAVEVSSE